MIVLAVLIFVGVFAVAAAYIAASGNKKAPAPSPAHKLPGANQWAAGQTSPEPVIEVRKSTIMSTIPWMNRWLAKFELAPMIRLLLYQASVKWTVGGLLLSMLAASVAAGYLVWLRTRSLPFAAVCGPLVGFLPMVYVLYKRMMRFKKFEEELPGALDLMVSALRVGQSLNSALSLVAQECPNPISGEFRICFDEQNFGLELRAAMNNMLTRVPVQDLMLVTTAILIQKESGGNLAEVLDKSAHVTRERFRIKREIKTRTAQGRMTGWVLTGLPVGLGLILYFVNPKLMSVLWTHPIGVKLLWGASGLIVLGSAIIQKIVRIEV
jgi:tight adherence protein B